MDERRTKRATLRDVAEAAGVSVWTASNTFSNPDRVAAATRERVLAAADALDYAGPNPGARTLALGRTNMIALVAPGDAAPLLRDSWAAQVAQGLLFECDRSGLSLVLAGTEGDVAVDGRVYLRAGPAEHARGPVVVVDGTADGVPCVRADVEAAAGELAGLVLGLGHRRIAVIAGPGDDSRLQAALGVLDRVAEVAVVHTTGAPWATDAHGEAAARHVLATPSAPTALMALSDPLAMGALDAVARMGRRVPHDISVTGLGDLPGSAERGLTTALVPYRPMGEAAGRLLIERIAGKAEPSVQTFPAPLTIRATTAPPPIP